ncbi:hypothetical protein D3C76_803410 [compost metagenome]
MDLGDLVAGFGWDVSLTIIADVLLRRYQDRQLVETPVVQDGLSHAHQSELSPLEEQFPGFWRDRPDNPEDDRFLEILHLALFVSRADGDTLLHTSNVQSFLSPVDDDVHVLTEHFQQLPVAFGDLGGLTVVVPHRGVVLIAFVQTA